MRIPHILVIDSGVGGLTVTDHVRRQCSGCAITYIADLAYFPYGNRPEAEVIARIDTLVGYGMRTAQPDVVVIACNTASTVALNILRQGYSVPFVGVVPAIKPAAALTQTGAIGLLATRGTVTRQYTQALIEEFAPQHKVSLYGSRVLVELSENKLRGIPPCPKQIQADVEQLVLQNTAIDTIVLACTHFPLLTPELTSLFPKIRHWVDSGEAIAKRVKFLLKELELSGAENASPPARFILTASPHRPYDPLLLRPLLGEFEPLVVAL